MIIMILHIMMMMMIIHMLIMILTIDYNYIHTYKYNNYYLSEALGGQPAQADALPDGLRQRVWEAQPEY